MTYMQAMNSRSGRRQTRREAKGGGISLLHTCNEIPRRTHLHGQLLYDVLEN